MHPALGYRRWEIVQTSYSMAPARRDAESPLVVTSS